MSDPIDTKELHRRMGELDRTISILLRDFELITGRRVESVSLVESDVTGLNDSGPRFLTDVIVKLVPHGPRAWG